MSENWQVGDLALCVYQGDWYAIRSDGAQFKGTGPKAGQVLTVRSVQRSLRGVLCLLFSDYPDPDLLGWCASGYNADCFRKISPPEADEFDREVIELMTSQPEQVPA